jgi:hypothetical protein
MNKGIENLSAAIDKEMSINQINHEKNRVKYKIDVDEEIPLPQIAWSLTNIKTEGQEILGTLGNFSLIIGKAKVKKSFFISIAISTSLSNDLMLERFSNGLPNDKNEILYFDTEQSKYHVQKAVKRICELTNQPSLKKFKTFGTFAVY